MMLSLRQQHKAQIHAMPPDSSHVIHDSGGGFNPRGILTASAANDVDITMAFASTATTSGEGEGMERP